MSGKVVFSRGRSLSPSKIPTGGFELPIADVKILGTVVRTNSNKGCESITLHVDSTWSFLEVSTIVSFKRPEATKALGILHWYPVIFRTYDNMYSEGSMSLCWQSTWRTSSRWCSRRLNGISWSGRCGHRCTLYQEAVSDGLPWAIRYTSLPVQRKENWTSSIFPRDTHHQSTSSLRAYAQTVISFKANPWQCVSSVCMINPLTISMFVLLHLFEANCLPCFRVEYVFARLMTRSCPILCACNSSMEDDQRLETAKIENSSVCEWRLFSESIGV